MKVAKSLSLWHETYGQFSGPETQYKDRGNNITS
jgi:hypothetical protein